MARRPDPAPLPPPPYRLAEVAARLGLSPKHVYALAARGEIPGAYRIGRNWYSARPAVDRLARTGKR